MANKRQPSTMTPQDRQIVLVQIERIRSQNLLLETELLGLQKKTRHIAGSGRSPGRFKGRFPVPEAFFEPLTDEELKDLSGG